MLSGGTVKRLNFLHQGLGTTFGWSLERSAKTIGGRKYGKPRDLYGRVEVLLCFTWVSQFHLVL